MITESAAVERGRAVGSCARGERGQVEVGEGAGRCKRCNPHWFIVRAGSHRVPWFTACISQTVQWTVVKHACSHLASKGHGPMHTVGKGDSGRNLPCCSQD